MVFNTGADPVKMGLVTNLRQPGGNVTGITFISEELGAKALSLLRELVPGAKTIGLMINPSNPETPRRSADAIAAARTLGLAMEVVHAATAPDIEKAFDSLSERRVGALLLGADAFYGGRIQQIVSLAARHKMPAMYYRREFAEAGSLASYGASVDDAYRQAGVYVARVLNGDKPGELPVMQAAKFEFVLNLKTARALGIDVPMAFSAAADEIIECPAMSLIGTLLPFAAMQYHGRSWGRVEMWRGGCRLNVSVAASFVWRCLSGSAMAPFPHPAHRTGHADLPHPALGQDFTPSPTARRAQAGTDVRARSARKGARVDKLRPCVA